MLGIGCPDRHAFLFMQSPPPKTHRPRRAPPRESGFVLRREPVGSDVGQQWLDWVDNRPSQTPWASSGIAPKAAIT
jgi:hypothetical protein